MLSFSCTHNLIILMVPVSRMEATLMTWRELTWCGWCGKQLNRCQVVKSSKGGIRISTKFRSLVSQVRNFTICFGTTIHKTRFLFADSPFLFADDPPCSLIFKAEVGSTRTRLGSISDTYLHTHAEITAILITTTFQTQPLHTHASLRLQP